MLLITFGAELFRFTVETYFCLVLNWSELWWVDFLINGPVSFGFKVFLSESRSSAPPASHFSWFHLFSQLLITQSDFFKSLFFIFYHTAGKNLHEFSEHRNYKNMRSWTKTQTRIWVGLHLVALSEEVDFVQKLRQRWELCALCDVLRFSTVWWLIWDLFPAMWTETDPPSESWMRVLLLAASRSFQIFSIPVYCDLFYLWSLVLLLEISTKLWVFDYLGLLFSAVVSPRLERSVDNHIPFSALYLPRSVQKEDSLFL